MKDERLYMTFPNDMHRHPKIARLPVEVRWTFVEMNGEARIADNDGRFTAEEAEFLWPEAHLRALLTSHPTRPLLVRDGTDYVIREYAKHQQTRADREELSRKRAEAGRKGGQAKGGQAKGQASVKQVLSGSEADAGKQKHSQSHSHSQRTTTYVSESQSLDNRARSDEKLSTTEERMAAQFGVQPERVQRKVADQLGINLPLRSALSVAVHILSKPAQAPRTPMPYVLGAITRSPAEVAQYIHELGLEAA